MLTSLDPSTPVTAWSLCALHTLIRPDRQTGRRARRTASAWDCQVGFLFTLKKTSHPICLQEQNLSFHFTPWPQPSPTSQGACENSICRNYFGEMDWEPELTLSFERIQLSLVSRTAILNGGYLFSDCFQHCLNLVIIKRKEKEIWECLFSPLFPFCHGPTALWLAAYPQSAAEYRTHALPTHITNLSALRNRLQAPNLLQFNIKSEAYALSLLQKHLVLINKTLNFCRHRKVHSQTAVATASVSGGRVPLILHSHACHILSKLLLLRQKDDKLGETGCPNTLISLQNPCPPVLITKWWHQDSWKKN